MINSSSSNLHIHNNSSMDSSETWTTRNKRSKPSDSDDEYLALCLVMLARGVTDRRTTPPGPVATNYYTCTVCAKSFSSYQALGGHKASHRTKPPLTLNSPKIAAALVSVSDSSVRVHKCSICHKCFPTGQALGGHKRRHYDGATTTTTTAAPTFTRNFDLNLPAAPPELSVDLPPKTGEYQAAEEDVETAVVP